MKTSLFNTPAETATRLAMCLPHLPCPATLDEITSIDLAATYMKPFGFGSQSLHGDTPYAAAEYDARRRRVHEGLARLVRTGLAETPDNGITFSPTTACQEYSSSLRGDYAHAYTESVARLIELGVNTVVDRVQHAGVNRG